MFINKSNTGKSSDFNQEFVRIVSFGCSWFVSPQFLFYDLMREVIRGTYTSLIFSMLFALVVLLLTSGNVLITLYAMLTITFIIADTVAVFVLCGWELNILETIIIIMSVGLSVDFSKKIILREREEMEFSFFCSGSLWCGVYQSRLEEKSSRYETNIEYIETPGT